MIQLLYNHPLYGSLRRIVEPTLFAGLCRPPRGSWRDSRCAKTISEKFLTDPCSPQVDLLGEIIATQRRATPTQRHAKHGSTLKEKLAFLSGTMDFHKPNGSEQIQFFPNIPENIFGNDQREFHQYRMKKNYFRSRRCV